MLAPTPRSPAKALPREETCRTYTAADPFACSKRALYTDSRLYVFFLDEFRPVYETNWDLWQQWTNQLTMKVPYHVSPGNHEASCAEFDDSPYYLTELLNHNLTNTTTTDSGLSYWSCPPSQRNFTRYQNSFRMPSRESGVQSSSVGNMWHSFNYGLVHVVMFDAETDFPKSPEYSFQEDLEGNQTVAQLTAADTYPTDSGPFGVAGNSSSAVGWEQYQWMKQDLAAVNRTLTPWVIALSHRPMFTSGATPAPMGKSSSYESAMYHAFGALFQTYGVDMYFCGHIHWYERLFPMLSASATPDMSAVTDLHNYIANGRSTTHIVVGSAGNIEDHSTGTQNTTYSAVLNQNDYGMGQLEVFNATTLQWRYIAGDTGIVQDIVTLRKPGA